MLSLVVFLAPLTLVDALALAEQSPDQKVAAAQIPVAHADTHTAGMFPNPGISVGGGRAEPAFNASVILRLPIFGQRGRHIEAAKATETQVASEAEATRWHLRHDARVAYYNVARADEEAAIAVEVEALSRRIADMAREKLEVGTGTRLDERQASLVHIRAQQDVVDREAAAHVARIELARQLALNEVGPLADRLDVVGPTPTLDEDLQRVVEKHPDLRALRNERLAALQRARAARSELRPTLTVEAGLELLDPVTCGTSGYCLGPRGIVGFDLPIFNLNGGPVERALAEAHVAEAKAWATRRRIESTLRAAHETLDAAVVRVRFFDGEYVPNATEVEGMAREGFSVGRSGILPLIEAERAVLDARLGRTEALFAVQAARADLEECSGLPLPSP